MPAALYLRPQPRAYYLITETHALVFRQPDASETKASRSVVVAEFLPIEEVDTRDLIRVGRGLVEGVLGVTSVPTERSPVPEIFLLLVAASTALPPLLPSSSLRPARVLSVEFHSLSSNFWDGPELRPDNDIYADDNDPYGPSTSYNSSSASNLSLAAQQGVENPCNGMRKYLESGGFFYADQVKWDISSRMGETNWIQAEHGAAQHPLDTFDERFVWNSSLLVPLLDFRKGLDEDTRGLLDEQALIIPVIQGFCGSLPVSTGTRLDNGKLEVASLGLISRLSWKRAGARFRTRGIDDDGQVANFVETELILGLDSVTLSYAQIRGSVPLFWQQPSQGLQTLQQKVEITRPPQASQPAFDKHFMGLLDHYHSVHAINLLGQKDAESMLSNAYSDHLDSLHRTLEQTPRSEKVDKQWRTVSLTPYDFHANLRAYGNEGVKLDFASRIMEVAESMRDFGWTSVDTHTGQVIEQQEGVFRTNCLDCLDRTNYVQDVISSITLSRFLGSIGSSLSSSPTLWAAHRELWADNGDRLSKIYAGTGAINTSATRSGKKTFAGLLSDATKSVGRAYINNFQDKGKQTAIDMLLGMMAGQRPVVLFDPIGDSVHSALAARLNEYSTSRKLNLFMGTWNLNGKVPDEALDDWLFPSNTKPADIYAIAFQEIVELTASQILATDPAKRRLWEKYIIDTFAMRFDSSEYLLYRSEQLVGTALIIVVKSNLATHIRRVESATKKTGLQGLSGNKGGVGIRLDLYDSSICLMTCHLAAGHSNVAERNADYRTISTGLKFLRGKSIEDHDIVIWAADFNYRISLPNEEVRQLAESDRLDGLLAADQLLQAMDDGEVFHGYDEGPIIFRPTYKYDNGTDWYDTSEKARIPAWTDRVLFKGSSLRLKEYNRADLRTSDHRPVYALFEATIREVDQVKKAAITKSVLRDVRGDGGRLDDKVQKASGGGVQDLVRGMTKASVSKPALTSAGPKLPPRPSPSADSSRASPSPAFAPTIPPRPKSSSVSSTLAPTRKPAPPLPQRSPSTTSLVPSGTGSSNGRRPPPAVPFSNKSQPQAVSATAPVDSPTVTPASTGDFLLVTSPSAPGTPPNLPPRATPVQRPSLDINSSPPKGLSLPVPPDQKKTAGTLAAAGGAASTAGLTKRKAPPPVVAPKPKPDKSASLSSGPGAAAVAGGAGVAAAATGNQSETSTIKKAPPAIAAKPAGLRTNETSEANESKG